MRKWECQLDEQPKTYAGNYIESLLYDDGSVQEGKCGYDKEGKGAKDGYLAEIEKGTVMSIKYYGIYYKM